MKLPLAGLRILDVGTRIGAPFAATLLGDFGAEVWKVEIPGQGDFLRTIGPFVDGHSLFWAVENRGKKSITCDLRKAAGQALLRRRRERQQLLDEGGLPDFLEETEPVRSDASWKVAPIPADLRDRRVEITGPTDRKMVINALNSGARVFMADFEDANSPTWDNNLEGHANLIDAIEGVIEFKNPDGKEYRLDEKTAYLQISFFHGYVVFDLERGVVTQVVNLPVSEYAQSLPKSQYVLNSAHHGLAIDAPGTQLCVAGTMDDYVALVNIANPADQKLFTLPHTGDRPYWATNAAGDAQCWVSIAGDDRVNVYDYAKRKQVGSIPVGDHPQRVRAGSVAADVVSTWGRP